MGMSPIAPSNLRVTGYFTLPRERAPRSSAQQMRRLWLSGRSSRYMLSRERVCHSHKDAGPWLPSRCLAMDARSDSDIPAFRRHATLLYLWKLSHSCNRTLRNRVLVEKLIVAYLVNKYFSFYWVRSFTTVFTRDRHLFHFWARWIQPKLFLPIVLRSFSFQVHISCPFVLVMPLKRIRSNMWPCVTCLILMVRMC
jgi:hypothetical protein